MKTVSSALALTLLAAPAAAQSYCPEEENLRSANSNQSAAVTFLNSTRDELQAYWLDFDGKRKFYAKIPPGGAWTAQTYVTHPWVIVNRHGECVAVHFPEAEPREIGLRPPG